MYMYVDNLLVGCMLHMYVCSLQRTVCRLTTQTLLRDGNWGNFRKVQIPFILNTNMYRTVACNKRPVQHQCMDMMGLCIMLYVFIVAQTITNTTRLSHAAKIHCVYCSTFCCCQTQNGDSPVYVASENGHTEVVDLLVQAGADIHLATTDEVHVSTHSVLFSSSSCGDYCQTHLVCSLWSPFPLTTPTREEICIVNPQCACDIHASVCVPVKSHLTSRMSNRAINKHA